MGFGPTGVIVVNPGAGMPIVAGSGVTIRGMTPQHGSQAVASASTGASVYSDGLVFAASPDDGNSFATAFFGDATFSAQTDVHSLPAGAAIQSGLHFVDLSTSGGYTLRVGVPEGTPYDLPINAVMTPFAIALPGSEVGTQYPLLMMSVGDDIGIGGGGSSDGIGGAGGGDGDGGGKKVDPKYSALIAKAEEYLEQFDRAVMDRDFAAAVTHAREASRLYESGGDHAMAAYALGEALKYCSDASLVEDLERLLETADDHAEDARNRAWAHAFMADWLGSDNSPSQAALVQRDIHIEAAVALINAANPGKEALSREAVMFWLEIRSTGGNRMLEIGDDYREVRDTGELIRHIRTQLSSDDGHERGAFVKFPGLSPDLEIYRMVDKNGSRVSGHLRVVLRTDVNPMNIAAETVNEHRFTVGAAFLITARAAGYAIEETTVPARNFRLKVGEDDAVNSILLDGRPIDADKFQAIAEKLHTLEEVPLGTHPFSLGGKPVGRIGVMNNRDSTTALIIEIDGPEGADEAAMGLLDLFIEANALVLGLEGPR